MIERLKTRIKDLWAKALPAVRPAVMTFGFTFVAAFSGTAFGWLGEVSSWLTAVETPEATEFPDPSVLGSAALSAIAAAGAGLVNYLIRAGQLIVGRGKPPSYD